MRPKVKYAVIYRHRKEYPVSVMCRFFGVSRSGYYDFVHRLAEPEKDASLAELIRQQQKAKLLHLWIPQDADGISGQRNLSQSQNSAESNEKV